MRDDAKYYRADWMNDDQWECAQMLADLAGGFHHVMGTIKPCNSRGIQINERGLAHRLSTFDFDRLTHAVIMAHDRAIRFEVSPSGPGMLRLTFHKRAREGNSRDRHPTMEEAMKFYRRAIALAEEEQSNG